TVDFFPPVVDDPFTYGQIAAANALSDVYSMGGRPVTALNIVAFPGEGLAPEVLHEILRGGVAKLKEAGVALVGGHTVTDPEVKYGLAITGLIDPERVVSNAGARPGDWLILTKPIGVGAITTAIKQYGVDPALVTRVVTVMAALNREAAQRMLEYGVHACTDITGYGLLGHALKMASASRVCLEIEHQSVPHFPEALELCAQGVCSGGLESNRQAFSSSVDMMGEVPGVWQSLLFDPQTSGGLLIALPEADARMFLHQFDHVDVAVIGRVVTEGKGEIVVK
ncbi:MAG: selenide, water dikinase SelD, partial [Proteobacteria bacterium]|nr:selenide, water dikinase SelD [Pseudomonadota bacterium]